MMFFVDLNWEQNVDSTCFGDMKSVKQTVFKEKNEVINIDCYQSRDIINIFLTHYMALVLSRRDSAASTLAFYD